MFPVGWKGEWDVQEELGSLRRVFVGAAAGNGAEPCVPGSCEPLAVSAGCSFAVCASVGPNVGRPKLLARLCSGGHRAVNDMFGAADITGLG